MVIRTLRPADADRYVVLRREMLEDSPWAFGSSPGNDRAGDAASVRASMARPFYALIGAWEDEVLCASAGIMREEQPKRSHLATIWGVYATPRVRGAGIGRALVAAALVQARAWPGIERVGLSVSDAATAARRTYEALGFETWGVEPDCLKVGGRAYAEAHMSLRL